MTRGTANICAAQQLPQSIHHKVFSRANLRFPYVLQDLAEMPGNAAVTPPSDHVKLVTDHGHVILGY